MNVQAGKSLTVTMTVSAPASCQTATYSWTAETKQSNDFSGLPGNDLTLDMGASSVTTRVLGNQCATGVAFATEPQDAGTGQHITGAADQPSGPPITVDVVDSSGHIVTGSSAPVTIALGATRDGDAQRDDDRQRGPTASRRSATSASTLRATAYTSRPRARR